MFEYGSMLWMKNEHTGDTLYMVTHSPVVCEVCSTVVYDWELNEEGILECPHCGNQIKEFRPQLCRYGKNDLVSVVVAANNNFGCTYDGEMLPYNHMVNRVITTCRKLLEKEVKSGAIRLLSPEESVYRKRMLVWTAQNTYEPGTEMPQWIKDQFPMP